MIDDKIIYGIGISIINDLYLDEIIEFSNKNKNAVLHMIAGIIDSKILDKIYDNNMKLLILGYKNIGKGISYYSKKIEDNIQFLEKHILDISKHFEVVSFDKNAGKLIQYCKDENIDITAIGGCISFYRRLLEQYTSVWEEEANEQSEE